MKLILTDYGDPSVGIHSTTFEVDCPFEKEDTDDADLDFFKADILKVFAQFAQGKLVADYDFEIKARDEGMENQTNCWNKDNCGYFLNYAKCNKNCIKYNY